MSSSASVFRSLHQTLLVLPNAWDAGSALVFESSGAKAIATSSAAVSWAHGVPDGENVPRSSVVEVARNIVRAVRIPVSVDVEAGYAAEPSQVAELVKPLLDVGVVGINIEDGRESPELLAKKLEVARAVAERAGVDVFINARIDVYLKSLVSPERRLEEVTARAALYRKAGCDGLFVPKIVDQAEISALVARTELPINVLAVPGLPRPDALRELGVRRLSVGQGLFQVAMAAARRAASELLLDGEYARLFSEGIPFAELDALVRARM